MIYQRTSAFFRSLKSIADRRRLELIEKTIEALVEALENQTPPSAGLGLKLLRADIWEIRAGIRDRVLFRWHGHTITFILAGNHEDIRRFLKSY